LFLFGKHYEIKHQNPYKKVTDFQRCVCWAVVNAPKLDYL